jgi:hypothetical protein
MSEKVSITVALYGFEEESNMLSAFANAGQWTTPWIITEHTKEAHVIILEFASEADHETLLKLKRDFPMAEIIAFSAKKPAHTKWHLVRQPGGKVSIVGFSQLVLKISHFLKRKSVEVSEPEAESFAAEAKPEIEIDTKTELEPDTELSSRLEEDNSNDEPGDFMPFFDSLDSILDSKPNEKRKRFNEQK